MGHPGRRARSPCGAGDGLRVPVRACRWDYEVFILARIREEYDATGLHPYAVIEGSGAPAGWSPARGADPGAGVPGHVTARRPTSRSGHRARCRHPGRRRRIVRCLLVPALAASSASTTVAAGVGRHRILRVAPSPLESTPRTSPRELAGVDHSEPHPPRRNVTFAALWQPNVTIGSSTFRSARGCGGLTERQGAGDELWRSRGPCSSSSDKDLHAETAEFIAGDRMIVRAGSDMVEISSDVAKREHGITSAGATAGSVNSQHDAALPARCGP